MENSLENLNLNSPEAFKAYKQWLFGTKLEVELTPGNRVKYLQGVLDHPGQKHVHFSAWRFYVAVWGRRTGKTIMAAAEVVAQLAVPRSRSWIVAPSYELTNRVFEYVYRWVVLEEVFGPGSVVRASKTKDLRYIETKWGSFVQGKSAEAPNSLIGEQLDLVVFDECARCAEIIWEESLRPCLVDRQGKAIFISTPRGKNWFFQYYRRRLDPELSKDWAASRVKTAENPYIPESEIAQQKATTSPDVFRREYEASFESFTGLIWPMFRNAYVGEGGQVYDPNKLSLPEGTDYAAVDIGWRHSTACVWGRVDREDNVWIFREYLGEPSVVHGEHAKNIAVLSSDVNLFDIFISPDAKRKIPVAKRAEDTLSPLDIYRENGLYCRPANNDVMAGISVVGQYLQSALAASSDHPAVYISEHCQHLIDGIETYIFHETNLKKELDEPDKPRKYKDDLADAFRYLLASKPRYVPTWARLEDEQDELNARYGYRKKTTFHPRQAYPGAPVILE